MNKAFNRKGKLSFEQAYPMQYIVAYFVNSDTSKYAETINTTTFYVSDAEPSSIDFGGYDGIRYADVSLLVNPA